MKKTIVLFILILALMGLSGCRDIDLSTTTRVIPPKVDMPIKGTWRVEKYILSAMSKMKEEEAKEWIGQKASFQEQNVILPDDNCEKPEFKIRSVDTKAYLYSNYKSFMENIGISQSDIKIITITSNKNYFRDIIKLDDNTIIIIKEGVFFFMSEQPKDDNKNFNEGVNKNNLSSANIKLDIKEHQSGLLLGLKYYKAVDYKLPFTNENNPILEPVYRTLWISYNGLIQQESELPFLFVPRRTGFWKLDTKREITNNSGMDILMATPNGIELKQESIKLKSSPDMSFYDLKSINFVGNDYVCYERDSKSSVSSSLDLRGSQSLEVVALDTIYTRSEIPIDISKLLGEEGKRSLNAGAKSYLNTIPETNKKLLGNTPATTNFGVFRKNGKWLLRGRLNYLNLSKKNDYEEFNIPIVAPSNLVNYDSLFPSWEVIKQKVPSAVDGYTSPNKDIVVVLTKSKVLVYAIKDNILANSPLSEIQLKSSETAVMSQWALDDYVRVWSEEVKKLEVK